MTHRPSAYSRALFVFAVLGFTACECSDDPQLASLTLITPAKDAVLTPDLDTDPDRAGFQFDVVGEARRIEVGTRIQLHIDDVRQGVAGEVDDEGRVELPGVTLPPGTHRIFLQTAVGSVKSDDQQQYTLRALVITAPQDGTTLSDGDDQDASEPGVQIDVEVEGHALGMQEVALLVDGDEVAMGELSDEGTLSFSSVTIDPGEHTLTAVTGEDDDRIESAPVEVEVRASCADVEFVTPEAPSSGDLVLGGSESCPDGRDPFTIEVVIATDASDGRPAALLVNGTEVAEADVADGRVTFSDVVLPNASNTLAVDVEDDNGVTCRRSFPADVMVDCSGPDCFIRSPVPHAYVDSDDETTLYLNASHLMDGGFGVEVESDSDAIGQTIALIVDGELEDAPAQEAEEIDGDAVAVFDPIELDEGAHTIEALCRDGNGNVRSSGQLAFLVDTQACGVSITDPAEDALIVPGDDEVSATDGIQVVATTEIEGDDCAARRSAVCDPDDGIASGNWGMHDGSDTALTTVTLDEDLGEQTLCVEVEDRAGNRALASVEVALRDDAPSVLFESPEDESSFNALGDDDHEQDAEPGSAVCDAALSIACEAGLEVSVRLDGASGTVLGTADCEEPGSGDPDLPTGYSGRAQLEIALEASDDTSVLVATQEVSGSSSAVLVGTSPAVTLTGDCAPPVLSAPSDPCALLGNGQIAAAAAEAYDITIADSTMDLSAVSLDFANTDGSSGTVAASSMNLDGASFEDVDLGGEGTVMITVTGEDDYGNTAVYMCEVEVVNDLPSIASLSPADGSSFGPGGQTCDAGAGNYGIRVEATVDQSENREASILVNGVIVASDVTITDTSIDTCVAVPDDLANDPDGASTITLQLEATVGSGSDSASVEVNVDTLDITDPTAAQTILSGDDCDGGAGFGYQVEVTVDAAHEGANYTLSGGAGNVTGSVSAGAISACVPLTPGGDRVITASLDGTGISESVSVSVLDDTPEIVSIDAPADDQDFGIDEQSCDAGAGNYGIRVQATVDQSANREASILVNGVVAASNVPISGTSIDACVAVPDDMQNTPDGPSTITLQLDAAVGAGSDSESVSVSVDTIAITDPTAAQTILSGDDCDAGAGFGYQVVVDVDPAKNGAAYSVSGGAGTLSGVVSGGAITRCVPVLTGGARTFTVTLTGTGISESVGVTVLDDSPVITSIDAPLDGESFGIGEQSCDAGAGNYGVRVQATVDQAANREATILVNGVVAAADVPIDDTSIDACVAVPDNMENAPDGASTLTLQLDAVVGEGSDSESVDVNVDTLEISDPVAMQVLLSDDDCDAGAGFGYQVVVDVDEAKNGESYTLSAGAGELTGTVSGGSITGCLPIMTGGDRTITVTLDGTGISDSVDISAFDNTPFITSIDAPTDGQSFGIDEETCDAGAGNYGVRLQATIDQAINREASVLVNGVVVATDVPIVGTSLDTCVPVPDNMENTPDGASTITLRLDSIVGMGSDSESVTVNVDTLELTDPVASQTILSGDDCDPGAGFGYQVEVDVDPSHDGAAYSLSGGNGPVTGMVASGAISRCLPLLPGGARTITVTLTGTGISESVGVTVLDDSPEILSLDEPTDGQLFGIGGQTCDAGAGNYGVRVLATVDQSGNREASILVNGVVALSDVPIAGMSIDACVAVPDDMENAPDGASTITLQLDAAVGTGSDSESVDVNVDTVEISDPIASQTILSGDDCDAGAGFGYQVEVELDEAQNGAAYTLTGGAGSLTGSVSGGAISRCLPLTPGGDRTITVSLDGTGISESVSVSVLDDTPEIVSIDAPADGASYGVGEGDCDAGAGNFGVRVQATVDQENNRTANILVNGVLAAGDVTITSTSIDECVAVPDDRVNAPDGPSTITLELLATVGTGSDSESVDVSIDTLDIVDPAADQLILSGDDCDAGAGFGYQLTVAVDPAHDGADFTLSSTGGGASVTGAVSGAVISECLPLVPGGMRSITAAIDGTGISESVNVTVLDDTPVITSIDAPADGASYGVGEQDCDAGPGNYGVQLEATVDQAGNRTANILVNGVLYAAGVAIVGTSINECVAVPDDMQNAPDGPSTITLELLATVGTGSDSEEVDVSVDTLELSDPANGAELDSGDDCDAGAGFGYQVVVDVDSVHDGASYTLSAGSGDITGMVAGNQVSGCVPLEDGPQTITATLDGTGISDSVDVDVDFGAPEIVSLDAPLEGAIYDVGEEDCDAGAGFGVRLQAEVDQSADRLAKVFVNGVEVLSNVPIAGTSIDTCVPVPDDMANDPDGPSTITLRLEQGPGTLFDEAEVSVSVDTLDITDPVASQNIGVLPDCDAGAGFGYEVTVDVDPSHNGAAYTLSGGSGDATGSVAGGQIIDCVTLVDGTPTITASLDGTGISESVQVTVYVSEPSDGILIETLDPPDLLDDAHRDGVTASWDPPVEDIPGQLVSYELRCHGTSLAMGATDLDKDNWWDEATQVALPGGLTPDDVDPSALLAFRPMEPEHCVVRALDAVGQGSAIVQSTDLTLELRQVVVSSGATDQQVGFGVHGAGDVDGDGFADVVAAGFRRAELFFGTDTGFGSTPDVVFDAPDDAMNPAFIHLRIVPAGDFNGDGFADFAILDADWNAYEGQVSIFFGRPRSDWAGLSPIDISGVACAADFCVRHETPFAYIGDSGAAVGDFNGDDRDDFAIGNSWYPTDFNDGQVLVLLGDDYEVRSCVDDTGCRAVEHCEGGPTGVCVPDGTFYGLVVEVPTGDYVGALPPGASNPLMSGFVLDAVFPATPDTGLGATMIGLGDYDGTVGTDIAVSTLQTGEVHFLSGRTHSGTPGFDALDESDLGLRDGIDGPTDGLPISTGPTGAQYGFALGALGDFYDPSSGAAESGRFDMAVSGFNTNSLQVVPGERAMLADRGFSAPERQVSDTGNVGQSIAGSYQPALGGVVGDLDGDGEPELCAGTRLNDLIVLFYPDTFATAALTAPPTQSTTGIRFPLDSNTADSTTRMVQFVGDVNGDGHLDLAVGDPDASSADGQVIVLY